MLKIVENHQKLGKKIDRNEQKVKIINQKLQKMVKKWMKIELNYEKHR